LFTREKIVLRILNRHLLISFGLAGLLAACNSTSGPSVSDQEVSAAMDKARSDFDAASSPEAKLAVAEAFLDRYPDSKFTRNIVRRVISGVYEDGAKDPQAALAFAEKRLAAVTDPDEKKQSKILLISLYGHAGMTDAIRKTVRELEPDPGGDAAMEGARAALTAKDWAMVREFAETAYQRLSNPPPAPADAEGDKTKRKRSETRLAALKCEALTLWGQSLVETGDPTAGIEKYQQAEPLEIRNVAGVGFDDLPILWANALLQSKDPAEAMRVLAADALIGRRQEAVELYRKAYLEAGNPDSGWEAYRTAKLNELAKPMIPFEATGYDGKSSPFDDLKGKVTMVAFWFPT